MENSDQIFGLTEYKSFSNLVWVYVSLVPSPMPSFSSLAVR